MFFYEHKTHNICAEHRPQYNFPQHVHYQYEVIVCTEGTTKVICGSKEYILHPGEGVLVMPHQVHGYLDIGKCMQYIFIFNQEILLPFANYANLIPEDCRFTCTQEWRFLIDHIYQKYKENKMYSASAYINVLMCALLPTFKFLPAQSRNSTTLEKALSYIAKNYNTDISLKSVAAHAGVSIEHLSRLFSAAINCNYHEYLTSLRINQAKGMLVNTDYSISHIAEECGFSTLRTFNRLFKEKMLVTPSQYRESPTDDIPIYIEDRNTINQKDAWL